MTTDAERPTMHLAVLRWLLIAMLTLVFITSTQHLGGFATIDEDTLWHGNRVHRFWDALLHGDLDNEPALKVCNKPGLTSAWIAGGGYLLLSPWLGSADYWPEANPLDFWREVFLPLESNQDFWRIDARIPIRAIQRLTCYAACFGACLLAALFLHRATEPWLGTSAWFRLLAGLFLALLLLANPVVRIYSRLVVTDGLTGCFGMLAVACLCYAVARDRHTGSALGALMLSGAATACSILSKYNGFFVLTFVAPAIFAWCLYSAARTDALSALQRTLIVLTRGLLRTGVFLIGLLATGHALQPLAWTDPARMVALLGPIHSFVGKTVWLALVCGLAAAVLAAVLVFRWRKLLAYHWRNLALGSAIALSAVLALWLIVGLLWQRNDLTVYLGGNTAALEPGVFAWKYSHAYSYQTGVLMTLLLHTKRLFTILACTCLLYTSPSPRDRTRSRMPSSA